MDFELLKEAVARLGGDGLELYSSEGPDHFARKKGGELYSLCIDVPEDRTRHKCIAYARGNTDEQARQNGRDLVDVVHAVPGLISEIERLRAQVASPPAPIAVDGRLGPAAYRRVSVAMAELLCGLPIAGVRESLILISALARNDLVGDDGDLDSMQAEVHRRSIYGGGPPTLEHEFAAALEAVLAVRRGDDEAHLHLWSFPTRFCFVENLGHLPQSPEGEARKAQVQQALCERAPEAAPVFEWVAREAMKQRRGG